MHMQLNIMIRSSVLRRISQNITINVHRISPFKHDYKKNNDPYSQH